MTFFADVVPAVIAAGSAVASAASSVAPVLTVASGLLGAGGSIISGIAANNAGKYQQAIAMQNAQIAEENSRRAIERGQVEQQDQDMQTRAELATQEAMQAGSGLNISGGSQMLTRKSAAELGRRDALNVRQKAEIDSYNFKTQAASAVAEGRMARAKGRNALTAGYINAGSSLINTASYVSDPLRFTQRKTGASMSP